MITTFTRRVKTRQPLKRLLASMTEETQVAPVELSLDEQIAVELNKESTTLEPETEVVEVEAEAKPETQAIDDSEFVPTESDKVQARINKKHFEMMEAKREAEALRTKLAEFETNKPVIQPSTEGAPKLEDFKEEDYNWDDTARLAAYTEALTDFKTDQKLSTFREREQAQQNEYEQNRKQEELNSTFLNEVTEYSVQHPSYMEDVQNLPLLSQDKLDLVRSQGAKMVHYLAKNPEIATQFANSDLGSAAFQLGTIANKLSTAKPTKQISSAPDPVTTIGGSAGVISKDIGEMTMAEIYNS